MAPARKLGCPSVLSRAYSTARCLSPSPPLTDPSAAAEIDLGRLLDLLFMSVSAASLVPPPSSLVRDDADAQLRIMRRSCACCRDRVRSCPRSDALRAAR